MKVTKSLTLIKFINGKRYPITVNLHEGKINIDISQHAGSDEQLTKIIQSVSDEFDGKFKVEKHIHKHHHQSHTFDANLEKEGQ